MKIWVKEAAQAYFHLHRLHFTHENLDRRVEEYTTLSLRIEVETCEIWHVHISIFLILIPTCSYGDMICNRR
jgi:hypothetical protein